MATNPKSIEGIYKEGKIELLETPDVDEARVIVYQRPLQYRATYYARSEVSPGSLDTTVAQLASVVGAGPRFLYMWWP